MKKISFTTKEINFLLDRLHEEADALEAELGNEPYHAQRSLNMIAHLLDKLGDK